MQPRLRRDKVSERSLEFNVLSELLEHSRRIIGKAYIVGYTTRQEALHGLDVSIDAPGHMLSAFQFKAPKSRKAIDRGVVYRFTIGDRCWICSNPRLGSKKQTREDIQKLLQRLGLPLKCINQHTLLYSTALVIETKLGSRVYYAFPLIYSYGELEQRIPGITNYTIMIRVRDLPISTVLVCGTHQIEIVLPDSGPGNVSVVVKSKPVKLSRDKIHLASSLLKEDLERLEDMPEASATIHIDPEELIDMLVKEFIRKAKEEEVDEELIQRIEPIAKALTSVSFSYRGSSIAVKKSRNLT